MGQVDNKMTFPEWFNRDWDLITRRAAKKALRRRQRAFNALFEAARDCTRDALFEALDEVLENQDDPGERAKVRQIASLLFDLDESDWAKLGERWQA